MAATCIVQPIVRLTPSTDQSGDFGQSLCCLPLMYRFLQHMSPIILLNSQLSVLSVCFIASAWLLDCSLIPCYNALTFQLLASYGVFLSNVVLASLCIVMLKAMLQQVWTSFSQVLPNLTSVLEWC
jgi:hypothetical protein